MFNRVIIAFLVSLFCFVGTATDVFASNPNIPLEAEMAIMIDASTGKVLFEKRANERAYPASTTKILTLITALDYNNYRSNVVVSRYAASIDGSSLEIKANEVYPIMDLMYGMMLVSGNDAATAIAEHVGGSVDNFARMMNLKAKNIGAYDSNFVNPSGLPNSRHYTTARDMAMIARYAMNNPTFAKIVGTQSMTWNRKNWQQPGVLVNTNKVLGNYFGATGMKTGYTNAAKLCLVASAERNGVKLIVVLFKSEEYCWDDAKRLLDYGFSKADKKVLYSAGEVLASVPVYKRKTKMDLIVTEDVVLTSFANDFDRYTVEIDTPKRLFAPIGMNDDYGTLNILYDGKVVRTISLVAKTDME